MTQVEAFEKIETWNTKIIKKVRSEAGQNQELQKAILQRYQPLIDHVEGKGIKSLSTIPEKIAAPAILKKQWSPDDTTLKILETLPVELVKLKKVKAVPDWIYRLKKTKALQLTECNLEVMPDLRGFDNLRCLNLYQNRLKELPDWLFDLPLREVDLSKNELESIPQGIGRMSGLVRLDLWGNKLTELPDSLGFCSALKELLLSMNNLSTLPASFEGAEVFFNIDISWNRFTELPEVISSFRTLQHLNFKSNEIEILPSWIGSLGDLECLNLERTKITALPEELARLKKLRCLDLRETPFQKGKAFASSLDREEIRNFLDRQCSAEEDPAAALYADLESREPVRIVEALKILAVSPELKERAEKRYIGFIRARLNDPSAVLDDFPRAALSPEEEILLLEGRLGKVVNDNKLCFDLLDGNESKLVVDFAGGMIASLVDMDVYVRDACRCEDINDIMSLAEDTRVLVRRAVLAESQVYDGGWFGRVYADFASLSLGKVMFDHTGFEEANTSLVLREFVLYLGCHAPFGSFSLDIFQSDPPDLTEVFWMLDSVPSTSWGDTEVNLPASPLSFTRKASVRRGDFDGSERVKSETKANP